MLTAQSFMYYICECVDFCTFLFLSLLMIIVIWIQVVEKLNRELFSKLDGVGAIIISPTRELAQQTYRTLTQIAHAHEVISFCLVFSTNINLL